MNLADHSVEKLPWKNSNDSDPVWVGNTVYFLSDRNFSTNVFSYRLDTKELKQLTNHDDFDVASLSATVAAKRPPTPASTSSKTIVATRSWVARTTSTASMVRDSSPPDAMRTSGLASSPGLAEN